MKNILRWILSLLFMTSGILHFVVDDEFIRMVPAMLPWPAMLVYVSGVAEIAGAIGLQIPRTRKWAAWGLVLLLIAVFPANVNMAIHHISPKGMPMGTFGLWARLPFQAVLIAWAYWYTRE